MTEEIYKPPEARIEDTDAYEVKRTWKMWLCFVYLVILSLLQSYGVIAFISLKVEVGYDIFTVLLIMTFFIPIILKIISGITLILFKKVTLPILIACIGLTIILFLFPPFELYAGQFSIKTSVMSITVMTVIHWLILLLILFYVINLNKKGILG